MAPLTECTPRWNVTLGRRQFLALMAPLTEYVCRWNPTLGRREFHARGRSTVTPAAPAAAGPLFAGHTPSRVFVGMAAPDSGPRPQVQEALTIIGQPVYELRRFVGTAISLSSLNGMLADADNADGAYPFVSFKEPFGAMSSGSGDARLDIIVNKGVARRTSGPGGTPQPFMCSFNHEPVGDGDLATWALDHIYSSNYMAGWRNGTRNPALDVTDIVAWACIPNGNEWGPKNFDQPKVDAMVPQALIDIFRTNKAAVCPDFYDPDPPNLSRDAPGGYASNADRTHRKVQAFIDWGRARNIGAVGCGEFSCVDAAGMQLTMDVMFANRDIWGVSNYFNSMANSRWEWRLIPNDYPAYNPPTSKGFVDEGGNVQTELRLLLFRDFLDQSVSPEFTGPVA